jgi:hypothetical protein
VALLLRKYASLEVLEAWRVPAGADIGKIRKAAHRVQFDYEPRPGYLYVRSRMISSRTNDNHDTFPAAEIEAGYKTFLGKPVFVNHRNANHRRARGVIVAVALHRDKNPDGTPDTWVEGLHEIDAVRFPRLCRAILARKVNRTSMGVDVEWSTCSACGNKATSPAEYCRHLPALKGKKIRKRNPATGKVEEKLIHEICAGLSFFENSLLVEEPADPTAYMLGSPDARGLAKAASASGPDFRDHIGNSCTACGKPVSYVQARADRGLSPWRHHSTTADSHGAVPSNPSDHSRPLTMTYGGTHCAFCHEPVKINLAALHTDTGGWHHGDGMRRDHPATPADPQAVYDAIPRSKAAQDQARQQMRDHMSRQFEQLSGEPAPQRPRGDEHLLPPDPFLASRRTTARTAAPRREGGDHPFFHANPVSPDNIVAAYHETTPDEKSLGDRWYADAHHVAKAISGGDAAKGAGVLSAYSPRTAWPVNMFNASRALQGDPPGPGSGAMGMHQKPAMRILAGEHHSKVLKAPKTAAFAHLIEHGGDTPEDEKNGTHKVVIDRHAMSVAMGRRIRKDDDAPLGEPQHYEHVAQAYRVAAHVLSEHYGRKISPHQVQAATWLGQIRKNQAQDSSGSEGGGGKGRVQMHDNARTKWQQHHQEHHHEPHHVPPGNMHYHGALSSEPQQCIACGNGFSKIHPIRNQSAISPYLCRGCADQFVQLPDQARPRWMDEEHQVGLLSDSDHSGPFEDHLRHSLSSRRLALGETRVPPQVDTLRMEECPVCGEHDVWSGDRCPVCGFIVPPSLFRDPDTSKAQQVRDELDQSGEVVTQPGAPGDPSTQPIGSGDDADDQLMHPDQIAPDGTPGVQGGPEGPAAGQPQEDGMPPAGQDEQGEGEQLEEQGEEDQEQGAEEEAEGQELARQGEEDQLAGPPPDLECPACGAAYSTDVGAQPGTPCPACRQGSLQPAGGPQKDQEDPDAEEEDEGEEMPATRTAAAIAQAQALRIAQLTAENEALAAQLSFLARAAGVDRQLHQIRQAVLRKHADVLNPASPVPDPPEAPAPESTEQALQPAAMDDPSRPGTTPGANAHVPAAMTTTSITPGVEMQTAPASNLVDVTAPVQGTNPSQDGGVPMEQRRIETDVRIDPDPLKAHGPGIGGQGDNGAAFPWLLDAQQPQGQGQRAASGTMPGEAEASRRTFASIRLAKLRITAGLAQGEELMLAERIEKDASMPIQLIEHEIAILSRMPQQGAPVQRPMQRAAARQAPSLASVGATAAYAPAAACYDDNGEDLFY